MTKIITLLLKRRCKFPTSIGLILSLVTLGIVSTWQCTQASTPRNSQLSRKSTSERVADRKYAQNAPSELTNLLTQIDTAANQGDIKKVIEFYSPNFTHGDGLNRQTLEKALVDLWKRYPKLRYSTQLQSWQSQGNGIVAETVTNITGLPSGNSNNVTLNATIRSRQRIAGAKIIRQDILSERTLLTSGSKPPQVDVKLPQQVQVGQQYNFDAIVQEPLGDEFLLGTAIEEPIKADKYLNPTPVDLELLNSGGLFKVGRAPSNPGSQWLSAVILRGDGMTMVTQRLQVVKK
ncbi:nuclear transport factor 2 family protein [Tolypothrix sp. PCC 7910]|uniref:nuclear transport factor 2 family protein n=1 Tax=Tolypothrix sp. PCC 7910 TaxID=2099387 RepID=UPI0014278CAD|nr:nuclear transport factor 2 family protein [Tolypothrix sp. PCC 7910]QIR39869.1 nuclear transport factor 2 family protein [Tolypothrix sp. PCC 7910]